MSMVLILWLIGIPISYFAIRKLDIKMYAHYSRQSKLYAVILSICFSWISLVATAIQIIIDDES